MSVVITEKKKFSLQDIVQWIYGLVLWLVYQIRELILKLIYLTCRLIYGFRNFVSKFFLEILGLKEKK